MGLKDWDRHAGSGTTLDAVNKVDSFYLLVEVLTAVALHVLFIQCAI